MEGRQLLTLKLSSYEGEIIPDVNFGGNKHNLDLNLGMSPSSFPNAHKGNDNIGAHHIQFTQFEMTDARRGSAATSTPAEHLMPLQWHLNHLQSGMVDTPVSF